MRVNSLCAVITAWLNASQRSRFVDGMNRSARGQNVKHFERSNGLDTALHKNTLLDFVYVVLSHPCSVISPCTCFWILQSQQAWSM